MPENVKTDLAVRLIDDATALVRAGEPFQVVYDRVIELAADGLPSPVWEDIGGIDLGADVNQTSLWLLRQLEIRPPPDELSALLFGLYEVRGPGPGRNEVVVALSGGRGFPDPSWLTARNWEPPGYAPAPGLRSLLPMTVPAGPEVREIVRSAVALAYAFGFTAAVMDALDPTVVLAGRSELGVATGFSDGNPAVVGILSAAGFDRSRLAEA